MEANSTSSTNATAKNARRQRKLILAHRRRLRKNLSGKPQTVVVHHGSSPMHNQTHSHGCGSSMGPTHFSPGNAFTTEAVPTGQSSNADSVARKRRREILSNRNHVSNHPNKENFSDSLQYVVRTTQTPTSSHRLPLSANLSNHINTAPSDTHLHRQLPQKRRRTIPTAANNLLATFNQTIPRTTNADHASTSNACNETLNVTQRIDRSANFADDSDSNSEDDVNLGYSSSDDDQSIPNNDHVDSLLEQYSDIGDRVWDCPFCHASMCVADGGGPPTLRLHGQTCHRIGTLMPDAGNDPQYAQLYIFDTDNEVNNRMKCFKDNDALSRDIVRDLKDMLDECNPHAKAFRMARDILRGNAFLDLKIRLISDRAEDGRVYNTPTVSEVAALIVGDIDPTTPRDIIVHARDGHLQQITEFHPAYLAYQYPLIFVYGEDGYRKNILHRYEHESEVTRKNRQSIKDWLCFRLQERKLEAMTLLHSRRLFQQFLVDGFAMMESERLNG
ncbi:uncharacterized protein LOC131635892 [Vicia villosa]|uniref:uncharacterized protein LOC131635892 n=1 Tax=Vicia villosa TaxID=3911 RepID=UPI00273B2294|nr:uncharacterized protein LOC131635892 [Vicia villosa]